MRNNFGRHISHLSPVPPLFLCPPLLSEHRILWYLAMQISLLHYLIHFQRPSFQPVLSIISYFRCFFKMSTLCCSPNKTGGKEILSMVLKDLKRNYIWKTQQPCVLSETISQLIWIIHRPHSVDGFLHFFCFFKFYLFIFTSDRQELPVNTVDGELCRLSRVTLILAKLITSPLFLFDKNDCTWFHLPTSAQHTTDKTATSSTW